MKILLVQDANWRKKGPHPQHHLMELLSQRGHEIVVIGYDQLWKQQESGFISHSQVEKNYSRVYPCKGVDYYQPAFLKVPVLDYVSYTISCRMAIAKIIKQYHPDVVITVTSIISSFWGVHFAQKSHIPFIYYWTDVIHELVPNSLFKSVGILFEKHILLKSTKVLYMNNLLGKVINQLVPNLSSQQLLPGGVDNLHFRVKTANPEIFQFNKSQDDVVFLFMGWIYGDSGLKEVISSISDSRHSNIKLIVIGAGPGLKELIGLATSLSLSDQVTFTGQKPYTELPDIMSFADFFILPAPVTNLTKDIVPVKIYEYLSMGCPVITTTLPGVVDEFGYNAGVSYVDSPVDIISRGIAMSHEERTKHKKNAAKFISGYSWSNILTLFEKILLEIKPRCE